MSTNNKLPKTRTHLGSSAFSNRIIVRMRYLFVGEQHQDRTGEWICRRTQQARRETVKDDNLGSLEAMNNA
ncbi:hypothetical protein Bca101_007992 [Brassica carinata]